ncbi:MAG: DUF4258 domain-containing protein [Candidatus Doudnabacteria bacterium]|nr:DUF4258 domain-containing protein [Candidatus Doudnabacteria bacterium]
MQIYFTRHAKNRMRWRKITLQEVHTVLNNFDKKEQLTNYKYHLYKSINNRLLRVTISEEQDKLVILSIVDKHD